MPKLIFFLFGVILQIAAQICGNYIRWAASELYALCLYFFIPEILCGIISACCKWVDFNREVIN